MKYARKKVTLSVKGRVLKDIYAIAWDQDGVIADTQRIHAAVESEICKEFGIVIAPHEISRRFSGMNTKEVFRTILAEGGKPQNQKKLEELLEKKWEYMLHSAEEITPMPGAQRLVREFYEKGIIQSVASSSRRMFIYNVQTKLRLLSYFEYIVAGEEVKAGKPAPDIFLRAASAMGIFPANCLVIEDAVAGVQAAQAAGMPVIFLGEPPQEIQPDAVIQSLEEINIGEVEEIE